MDNKFLDYSGLTKYTHKLEDFLVNKTSGFVPTTRTVNDKPLTSDISIGLEDVATAGDGVSIVDSTINVTNPVRGIFTQEEFDAFSEAEKNVGTYIIV